MAARAVMLLVRQKEPSQEHITAARAVILLVATSTCNPRILHK
jgi:hypothetical protein